MYLFDRTTRFFPFILNAKSNSLLCYLARTSTFSSPGSLWCGFFQLRVILFIFTMKIALSYALEHMSICISSRVSTQCASYLNTCTYIET